MTDRQSNTNHDTIDGDAKLTVSQRYILDVVERDGPMTRKEIKEETGLADSTLSRALKTLRNGGYLLRTRESEDLREVSYQIGHYPDV